MRHPTHDGSEPRLSIIATTRRDDDSTVELARSRALTSCDFLLVSGVVEVASRRDGAPRPLPKVLVGGTRGDDQTICVRFQREPMASQSGSLVPWVIASAVAILATIIISLAR
jgi:hypothetical protein